MCVFCVLFSVVCELFLLNSIMSEVLYCVVLPSVVGLGYLSHGPFPTKRWDVK